MFTDVMPVATALPHRPDGAGDANMCPAVCDDYLVRPLTRSTGCSCAALKTDPQTTLALSPFCLLHGILCSESVVSDVNRGLHCRRWARRWGQ